MAIAFVLINTKPLEEHKVYRALLAIPGIEYAENLIGDYDIILKVELGDFQAIERVVAEQVKTTPGVLEAKTLQCFDHLAVG